MRSHSITVLLLIAYLAAGLYAASFTIGLYNLGIKPLLSLGNAAIYAILVLPLLFALAASVAFFQRRCGNLFLWLSAIGWLILSGSELIEQGPVVPNTFVIIAMLLVSLASVGFLIFERKK